MIPPAEFIVIAPRITGNPERGYRTEYFSDLKRRPSRVLAVCHGWEEYGHDDWLIGMVVGTRLLRLAWMDEDRADLTELAEAADQLGFAPAHALTPPTMERTP